MINPSPVSSVEETIPSNNEIIAGTLNLAASAQNQNFSQVEPHIMIEQILSNLIAITADTAGFQPQEIPVDTNVLELGLDSLILFSIGQAIEKQYGVELKVSQFFNEITTLQKLAQYIFDKNPSIPVNKACSSNVMDSIAEPVSLPSSAQAVSPGNPALSVPEWDKNLSGDSPIMHLMQQQLQQMSSLANQNMQLMQQTIQQQLSVFGSSVSASVPQNFSSEKPGLKEAPSQAVTLPPASPEKGKTGKAETFRSLNLKRLNTLSQDQKAYIDSLVQHHIQKTSGSKNVTQESRKVLADWKHTLSFWTHLKEAKYPIISARSQGARFWDVDGNEYIDIAMGMGVHFFGHRPAFLMEILQKQMEEGIEIGPQSDLTGKVALLVHELTGAERVTFCNTGTESVMVAIRLARAATQRKKIVLFKNSYHGIFDGVLAAKTNDGIVPAGVGTPPGMIEDVYVLEYDHPDTLAFIEAHKDELAGILVEPVQSRNPDLQPCSFLRKLRRLTEKYQIALILDEMITGFRILPGGAQAWFGIQADIATYGKIAGGGTPVGIVAGKAKYMDYIDGGYWEYGNQSGPHSDMIYFGGTFARNPISMAGAFAALSEIKKQGSALQERVSKSTDQFCLSMNYWFEKELVPLRIKHFASQWRIVPLGDSETPPIEMELLFLLLMQKGVYTWERRINFFTAVHTQEDINYVEQSIKDSIHELRANGFPYQSEDDFSKKFYPISSVQRRMVAISHKKGGEMAYHLLQGFWIDGQLDIDVLEDSIAETIRRHESLRTRFVWVDGEWLQHIADEPRFIIARDEADEELIPQKIQQFIRPFDLSEAPLLRFAIVKVREDRYFLMVDAHHIITDGLSFTIQVNELIKLYEGKSLSPVTYQYKNCMAFLEEWQKSPAYLNQESFWRETLTPPLPVLNLPTDYPRPDENTFTGDAVYKEIDEPLTHQLKQRARENGVSLYMMLIAAYKTLLFRLTGQEDLIVAMPASGRLDHRFSETIGMFVNTVVARTKPQGDMLFVDFLQQVKEVCSKVYDNQDYPFERIAEQWNSTRPRHLNAIFDTMLSYEKTDGRTIKFKDASFTAHWIHAKSAMFDLLLDAYEEKDRLSLHFIFATQLFAKNTIDRWADAFVLLLQEIGNDPNRPLSRFDLLSSSEKQSILSWNQTSAPYPSHKTLVDLWEEQVEKTPHQIAVITNTLTLSYQELNAKVNSLSHRLQSQFHINTEEAVGVLLPHSEEVIITFLAILKSGGYYVPIDPEYPVLRQSYIANNCGCRVIITNEVLAASLPSDLRDKAFCLTPQVFQDEAPNLYCSISPDATAYVIYTSGSTGNPKGCMVSHRNVVRLIKNDRHNFDFSEKDVWIVAHSFCFDFSVWEMYGALLYGGKAVVPSREDVRNTETFHALLRKYQITVLNQTPAAFLNLIEIEDRQETHTLSQHLRYVIFGGDRLDPASLQKWIKHYRPDQIALVNMYGITETTVHVSYCKITENDIVHANGRSPIGRPIPETQIYICDPYMNLQPVGVVGEIYVGGTGVCKGYLHLPEITKERFIDNPFNPGERLYKSGDTGRWLPDGTVDYLGRNDQQIQIRGYRVELGEIICALDNHPQIEKSEVLSRLSNAGTNELMAYFTSKENLDISVLRVYLAGLIPSYMIPSYFVQIPEFPLTANGKIDRKALPLPEQADHESTVKYIPPKNETERIITTVWQDVLGQKKISVEDNFFHLGGDSIKAILIQTKLYRAGFPIQIRDLFEHPTAAGLARQIESKSGVLPKPEMKPVKTTGLSPIQQWFFENHTQDLHHFNQSVLLNCSKRVDWEKVVSVVEALYSHHEALRMYFIEQGELIIPEVLNDSPSDLVEVLDFQQERNPQQMMQDHAGAVQQSFCIAKGPLFKVVVYRMPENDLIFLVAHHLIVDGVSWRILLEDFAAGYNQVTHGEPISFSMPSSSYFQWITALHTYANNESLHEELAYWQDQENATIPPLPVDYSYSSNIYNDEEILELTLSCEETALLTTKVNQVFQTQTYEILLTAFVIALNKWLRQTSFRFFLEGHGRELIDDSIQVDRTVGWFTSLYPAVFHVSDGISLQKTIDAVRDTLRRIPQKGIGYGILRYLSPTSWKKEFSDKNHQDIVFNYLGQFDGEIDEMFTLSSKSAGKNHSHNLDRLFLLEINAAILHDQLSISIAYNRTIHRRESIVQLGDFFKSSLETILAPCLSSKQKTVVPFKYWELSGNDLLRQLQEIQVSLSDVEDIFPLSPLQEGMLFYALTEEGDRSYFEQFCFRINGNLNLSYFEESWNELAARHPILRTVFIHQQIPQPLQVVLKKKEMGFLFEDCRTLSLEEQIKKIEDFKSLDRQHSFTLSTGPLMRFAIFQVNDDGFEIIWSHHHILLDGWSLGILQQEFITIYKHKMDNTTAGLSTVPPYKTYIEWLEQQDKKVSREFWNNYLSGYETPVQVPGYQPSPSIREHLIKQVSFQLDHGASQALKELSKRYNVTVSTLFQTLWGILLAKYNNTYDIVFGVVVSGRPAEIDGVEQMAGLFIQSIPIRICMQPQFSFSRLLQDVQQGYFDCYAHQYYPLSDILDCSSLKQNLFNHLFIFENYPMNSESMNQLYQEALNLRVENVQGYERTNYDFCMEFYPEEQITIKFTYPESAFSDEQILQMEEHWRTLIKQVLLDESLQIKDIAILSDDEKYRLEKSNSILDISSQSLKTILEYIKEQVAQSPDSIAVESEDTRLTYQELDIRSERIAGILQEKEFIHSNHAAVFMRNSANYIISILAVQKACGVFIPVGVETPKNRFEAILRMVEPSVIIIECDDFDPLMARLQQIEDLHSLQWIIVLTNDSNGWVYDVSTKNKTYFSEDTIPGVLLEQPLLSDTMYIMFTSGTTGDPKAIMGSHEGASHFMQWEKKELNLNASVRAANLAASTFDVSLRDIFLPLVSGGTVCLPPPRIRENFTLLPAWLTACKISLIHVVPSIFRAVLKEIEAQAQKKSIPSLQFVLFAGEPLYGRDVQHARELLGDQIEYINLYGPTETSLAKFFYRIPKVIDQPNRMLWVGHPIAGTQVFILKDNGFAATSEIGEICIQPAFRCQGYFKNPVLTAEKFTVNPVTNNPQDIVYHTGDMGRYTPCGNVEILGRMDRQVKIAGVRVELTEIDEAVMHFEGIDLVHSMVHKRADGENSLVCYYTEKKPVDRDALQLHLKDRLSSSYIPDFLIRLDQFPLNVNGKVDAKSLPKPEALIYDRIDYVPPTDEIEKKLEDLWKEVLVLERVGVNTPFFYVGGNSLKAIRLISRINREFNLEIRIKTFFEKATIRKLAESIRLETRTKKSLLQPIPIQPHYALSHAQRRLWIMSKMDVASKAYNIPSALLWKGPLNLPVLQQVFTFIIARHESLRTTFVEINGEPRQQIHEKMDFQVEIIDCSCESSPMEKAGELMQIYAGQSFDLGKGPLLQSVVFLLKENQFILFFNIHHIVFDGWSSSVLIKEFLNLYERLNAGDAAGIPPLAIQYKEYAAWQNAFLDGDRVAPHREYWLQKLSGALPVLNLQTDRPRPAVQSFSGNVVSRKIDAKTVDRYRQICVSFDGSLFMGMVCLLKILLYRYTGQEQIVIGSPIAGRDEFDVENQIGFYVNTLVLFDILHKDDSVSSTFRNIKQTITEAMEHSAYPFDCLADDLQIERDMSRPPIVEVMVVYQNFDPIRVDVKGISVEEYPIHLLASKFTLSFIFEENLDGYITFKVEYNTDLFNRDRIARMMDHFEVLLNNACLDLTVPISQIAILPESEIEMVCTEFNRTSVTFPKEKSLVQLFEEMASHYPSREAIIYEDITLTYKEVNRKANQLANILLSQYHCKKGDRIAVLLPRSEWVGIAFLGILKAGGVYVPIDPSYPPDRIAFMLSDSQCSLILTDSSEIHPVEKGSARRINIRETDQAMIASMPFKPNSHDLAYIIYTSGSTGQPKGVMLEHQGAVNLCFAHRNGIGVTYKDRVMQFAPISFDASVWEMMMALMQGGALVVVSQERILNPTRFIQYLKEKHVSIITLPPSYAANFSPKDFSTLRILITGGEPARPGDVARFNGNFQYINAYGPTETTVCASYHKVNPREQYEMVVPIGSPIQNTEIFIFDQIGNICPIGFPGELHISGVGLARGYWNQEQLTKESFVPHPLRTGERIYKTGDIGYWMPDGQIVFLGRKDNQVKIRGFRVELDEIEHALLKHPRIQSAAVLMKENEDQSKELAGFAVSDEILDWNDVRAFLKKSLPEYMIPVSWQRIPQIPLLPNGKVDRDRLLSFAPDAMNSDALDSIQADKIRDNRLYVELVAIWEQVLGKKGIGINQRFFEIGGDSIRAIQIVTLMHKAGYSVEIKDIFQYPTIFELSARIEEIMFPPEEIPSEEKPIESISRAALRPGDVENIFTDD